MTLQNRLFALAVCASIAYPSLAAPVKRSLMPVRIGTCTFSTVKSISNRLVDGTTNRPIRGSGSAVEIANGVYGVYGVSYDQVAAVDQSRRGDRVMTCLVKVPTGCPTGDNRGQLYTVTNLRTEESWTLPDASHMCGGA
jgi:hypothetical protein